MSGIQKTTVYLDAGDYRRLKAMARARLRACRTRPRGGGPLRGH
jgi:hypothetical protein